MVAAVSRAVKASIAAAKRAVFPRRFLPLPHAGKNDVGILLVDLHFGCAGFVIHKQHALKRLAAVGGAIKAALVVRPEGMALHGDKYAVGISRINRDLSDLLPVAQRVQMRPRLARIGGFVHTVARRKIGPLQTLAAAHINSVGIAQRDRDGADGAR